MRHQPKAGALLTGSEYEAADSHYDDVSTVASSGTTETLDVSDASVHDVTLTDNCTFTFTGATSGQASGLTLVLRQDGTGSRTVTWPGSVVWSGGVTPTLSTTAAAVDVFTLFTVNGGTTWYGFPMVRSSGRDSAVYNRNSTSYTTTSTSFTDVDNTNTNLSLDTGASRVMVSLAGSDHLSGAGLTFYDILVDGTSVSGGEGVMNNEHAAGQNMNASFTWISSVLSAGTHTFELQWKVSAGTGTLFAGDGGANVLQFAAVEL